MKAYRLALTTAGGVYIVDKANVIRVEAVSNYSVFILAGNRKIIVSLTLKEFEEVLDDEYFVRISLSVIINLAYVVKYVTGNGGTVELSDGAEVEVSAQKKELLLQKLF